jgi:hypothetical protein
MHINYKQLKIETRLFKLSIRMGMVVIIVSYLYWRKLRLQEMENGCTKMQEHIFNMERILMVLVYQV